MYRPLPDGLTIKNSPIEGLGLFTNIAIKKNTLFLKRITIIDRVAIKENIPSEIHADGTWTYIILTESPWR